MHVGTIMFYLLLTLYGQLGSSNPSVTNNLPLTLSVLTLVSLSMTHLYLFLSYLNCYIGPCGVLVPTGMVHCNNGFELEFKLYAAGGMHRYIIITVLAGSVILSIHYTCIVYIHCIYWIVYYVM